MFGGFIRRRAADLRRAIPESASPRALRERRSLKIYMSYRRSDSADVSGRLYDRLVSQFGAESIFKDIDSIAPGQDFVASLRQEISVCDVFLILIGPNWLSDRIAEQGDYIRSEIELALELGKTLVPVLVNDARMPPSAALPASIQQLNHFNAAVLRRDPDFHQDCDRLVSALEAATASRASEIAAPPQGKRPTIFVSHSSVDRRWVEREVIGLLQRNSLSPWYSTQKIHTAAQWEREIYRGLSECDWFALVASKSSAKSEWVKDELNWAISNRPTRIVPIIMEKCDLYDFHIRLPRIQHVDFTQNPAAARSDLVQLLSQPTG